MCIIQPTYVNRNPYGWLMISRQNQRLVTHNLILLDNEKSKYYSNMYSFRLETISLEATVGRFPASEVTFHADSVDRESDIPAIRPSSVSRLFLNFLQRWWTAVTVDDLTIYDEVPWICNGCEQLLLRTYIMEGRMSLPAVNVVLFTNGDNAITKLSMDWVWNEMMWGMGNGLTPRKKSISVVWREKF